MNILFVTTKCPLPTNDGHSLRSFNLLKQAAEKHKIHLLSFVKYQQEFETVDELLAICASVGLVDLPANKSRVALLKTLAFSLVAGKPFVAGKYDLPEMRQAIRERLASCSIDLIHFDMLPLAVYLDEVQGCATILNEHNVESMLLQRRVESENGLVGKWFYTRQQKLLEQFERRACQRVSALAACSEQDKEILQSFAPQTPVTVVPNGVDTEYFAPEDFFREEPGNLLFVGGLNWHPNLDGLQWFDREIFPLVLEEYPNARLHIIGREDDTTMWRNEEYVVRHGFVDDIRPYMARASVFIVPLRIGGGTRLKILNSMSMGKAVVSTTIGAEGLGLSAGKNALLADREKDFAGAILSLFAQPHRRKELSLAARQFIEEHYKWEKIGGKLCGMYDEVINVAIN